MKRHICVIGGGASGLSAADHLRGIFDVTLFEAASALGGHASTYVVQDGPDCGLALDIAFMVMNKKKYPGLYRVLARLDGVITAPSEMSFSYCCRHTGAEYAINQSGNASLNSNTTRFLPREEKEAPAWLGGMIGDIVRFCRNGSADLAAGDLGDTTLQEYLDSKHYSEELKSRYIIPMGAALWSAPPLKILQFPAKNYLYFLENHGLLSLDAGLSWEHVQGGSQVYVAAWRASMEDVKLHLSTRVHCIERAEHVVKVTLENGESHVFDAVIIATHADEALALLRDASPQEQEILGKITYQINDAVLHWDPAVMPSHRTAWASWNYEQETTSQPNALCMTYYLNRLQGHRSALRDYFLTLNRKASIADEKILLRTSFAHPVFDGHASRSREALLQRGVVRNTCFAGAYLGYGFHEDAIASGRSASETMLEHFA